MGRALTGTPVLCVVGIQLSHLQDGRREDPPPRACSEVHDLSSKIQGEMSHLLIICMWVYIFSDSLQYTVVLLNDGST